jgi:rhamnosyltransferase
MRSYYIVRNGLVAKAIYPDEEHWKYYLRGWFYKRILCVLLYEDNKWAKLEGLITGYIHGKRGITGIRKRDHPDILDEKLLS